MSTATRKVVPIKRAPLRRRPIAKKAAPAKASGFAVGLSKAHYNFITATAASLGMSRQALMGVVVSKLVYRASLGGRRGKGPRKEGSA